MVQTMDTPPFDLQGFEPPISLWRLIEQHVPDHEKEEVKNMLGESLIDQSIELHLEIDTLLEIWREYRAETTQTPPAPSLPEPPGLRDRLVQEIQFFVENVKEKAKNKGVNPEKILSRHNTDVLEYALDTHRAESARGMARPLTARSSDGRETPMVTSPTFSSERASMASTVSEDIDSMNDKLNILRFDEVVNHLRTTLEDEVETLLKDIRFLQNCLDDEASFRAESVGTISREPTLAELSQERKTLEKDMFSNITVQTSPPLKNAFNIPSVIRPLGPPSKTPGKLKTSPGSTAGAKAGPLKAFTSAENKLPQSSSQTPVINPLRLNLAKDPRTGHHGSEHNNAGADKYKRTQSGIARLIGSDERQSESRVTKTSSLSHPDKEHSGSVRQNLHRDTSPVIEAVVMLSKESSGDASTELRMVPSPPSGKPTTPRPSSAQRFRKMVLECRD